MQPWLITITVDSNNRSRLANNGLTFKHSFIDKMGPTEVSSTSTYSWGQVGASIDYSECSHGQQ